MKIYIANHSKQTVGGGWTFIDNFRKYAARIKEVVLVDTAQECDIFLIPSATMVNREEVKAAAAIGKKIVLRIDNLPKNSRNRNTGISRLFDYAKMALLIVYQSWWAERFIGSFFHQIIPRKTAVIYNGIDTEIFNNHQNGWKKEGDPQFLYVRYNRDETKRWDEAWYHFQTIFLKHPDAHLWIAGNFSQELIDYDFDFFGGAEKRYKYWGVINKKTLAQLYRGADYVIIPYFNDACSNVILEARACGCSILPLLSGRTGGTPELLDYNFDISAERMVKEYIEKFKALLAG